MDTTHSKDSLVEQLVLKTDYKGKYNETKYIKVCGNGWSFQYSSNAPFSVKTNEQMMIPANCSWSLIRGCRGSDLTVEITTKL